MQEEPKYKTLAELVEAIKKGEVPEDAVLIIDNDDIFMHYYQDEDDEDDEGQVLFQGDTPGVLLVEALNLLGIPNGSI